MKKYEKPQIEIVHLVVEDIVTISYGDQGGTDGEIFGF